MPHGQGRKTALTPQLTPQQRELLTLTQQVHSATITPQLQLRARLILLLAHGHSITAVAAHLRLARKIIYKWLKRWQADGLKGLQDQKPGSSPAGPTPERRTPHALQTPWSPRIPRHP